MASISQRASLDVATFSGLGPEMERSIRDHTGWYFFQGIAFVLLGLAAVLLPGVTAVSLDLLLGGLFMLVGVVQLVASMQSRMHWWSFFSALLSIGAGAIMLWAPLVGVIAIVFVISAFLAVEGFIEIMLAFEFRPARNWGWMLVSGIAAVALSVLLWAGFPSLGVFYLGVMIAFNFIFYGVSLLILAASAHAHNPRQS